MSLPNATELNIIQMDAKQAHKKTKHLRRFQFDGGGNFRLYKLKERKRTPGNCVVNGFFMFFFIDLMFSTLHNLKERKRTLENL